LLLEAHPQLFSLSALQKSFDNSRLAHQPDATWQETHGANFDNPEQAIDRLAKLNGFTRLSKIQCPVHLAEGVIAVQRGKIMDEYRVYSRPSSDVVGANFRPSDGNNNSRYFFPPFREEDFTVYRNLEHRVDNFLSNKKEAWIHYIKSHSIVKTLHKLAIHLLPYQMQKHFDSFTYTSDIEQSNGPLCLESKSKEPPQGNEDLLVLYQGRLVFLEQVPPDYHLLALPPILMKSFQLPFKLKHSTTSSIIYVSFVTFGALPLAYRSVKYALDYPAMVEILLASFLGTLSYSIWYSRYGARVRQKLSIEKAVGARIVARDAAALGLLVEGAICTVTQLVLKTDDGELSKQFNQNLKVTSSNKGTTEDLIRILQDLSIDPDKIAHDITAKTSGSVSNNQA
jgi:hypothetical protein